MSTVAACSYVMTIIALILVVYAFYSIFRAKNTTENDLNVIQRQIRGFALLIVSNVVLLTGLNLCSVGPYAYIKAASPV